MSEPTDKKTSPATSSVDDDSLLRKIAHVPEAEPVATTLEGSSPPSARPRIMSVSQPELPSVGALIDQRYLVESVLGEGGMGVVFAARNQRTGREVALKLMINRERLSDAQHIARAERFLREARAAGRIRHPNVVDVYDVGGDNSAPYLVMERLRGRTLGARIAEGPIPEREAVQIMLAATTGVAAAHQEGVVHRDLKPENIFLAELTNKHTVPKVLDFGISRIVTQRESLDSLTRSGTILGTPAYMAPEQLRGSGEVDARADVFALGVILYEALSGRRPYEAHNFHDLVLRMAHDEPTPLAEVQPAASRHVRSVVERCLSRDPRERYADASELASALERVLAAPDDTDEKPEPRARKPGAKVWIAVAVLAGLVVVACAYLFSTRSNDAAVPAAESPRPPESTTLDVPAENAPQATPPKDTAAAPPPKVDSAPASEVTPAPAGSNGARQAPVVKPREGKGKAPVPRTDTQDPFDRARELRPGDF